MYSYRESMLALKKQITECDGKYVSKLKLKRRLYVLQRGKCCFCKRKMYASSEHTTKSEMATREHVVPKFHGGKDTVANQKLSCNRCNSARATLDFNIFSYVVDNFPYEKIPGVAKSLNGPQGKRLRSAIRKLLENKHEL